MRSISTSTSPHISCGNKGKYAVREKVTQISSFTHTTFNSILTHHNLATHLVGKQIIVVNSMTVAIGNVTDAVMAERGGSERVSAIAVDLGRDAATKGERGEGVVVCEEDHGVDELCERPAVLLGLQKALEKSKIVSPKNWSQIMTSISVTFKKVGKCVFIFPNQVFLFQPNTQTHTQKHTHTHARLPTLCHDTFMTITPKSIQVTQLQPHSGLHP